MAAVKSDRIKAIEALYNRPITAILTDLTQQYTYDEVCARLGNISRRTLIYWMQKYNITGPGRGVRSKTPAHKQKVAAKLSGRERSQETKNKISESLKGRRLSSETKEKISESLRKRKKR